jgi:hypothetical protein
LSSPTSSVSSSIAHDTVWVVGNEVADNDGDKIRGFLLWSSNGEEEEEEEEENEDEDDDDETGTKSSFLFQ